MHFISMLFQYICTVYYLCEVLVSEIVIKLLLVKSMSSVTRRRYNKITANFCSGMLTPSEPFSQPLVDFQIALDLENTFIGLHSSIPKVLIEWFVGYSGDSLVIYQVLFQELRIRTPILKQCPRKSQNASIKYLAKLDEIQQTPF